MVDKESYYLTTFQIPIGRFRFKHILKGSNFAGDAFQCKLDEVFWTEGYHRNCRWYDHIWQLLQRPLHQCHQFPWIITPIWYKFGCEKIQFKKTKVIFCDTEFNSKGHKPTEKKGWKCEENAYFTDSLTTPVLLRPYQLPQLVLSLPCQNHCLPVWFKRGWHSPSLEPRTYCCFQCCKTQNH